MGRSVVYVSRKQRVAICRLCRLWKNDSRYVCARGFLPKECGYVFYTVHPSRFCAECAHAGKCPFDGVRTECYYWWALIEAFRAFRRKAFSQMEAVIAAALSDGYEEEKVAEMVNCNLSKLEQYKRSIAKKVEREWERVRNGQ